MRYTVTGKSMLLWFQMYVCDICTFLIWLRYDSEKMSFDCCHTMCQLHANKKDKCTTDRTCWETWRASVMLFYSRLGVFTICSSVPVVTLCLPVTSASSSMLFQCRQPSEMSDKCWGVRLTNWLGRTMPITTPSADFLLKGKYCIFYLEACRQLRPACTKADVTESLKGVHDVLFRVYISRRIWILVSLPLCFFLPPRVNTCPNNCSGRGECRVGNSTGSVYCECEANWKGEACDVPSCQEATSCGYPERGHCEGKTCVCKTGWQGGLALQQYHFGCQWCDLIVSYTALVWITTMSSGWLQQAYTCQTLLSNLNKLFTGSMFSVQKEQWLWSQGWVNHWLLTAQIINKGYSWKCTVPPFCF